LVLRSEIRNGAYHDSVTLMNVARELSALEGVDDAAVVMGTPENREILKASGLLSPELASTGATDLLIVVRADDDPSAEHAISLVDGLLARDISFEEGGSFAPRSLSGALKVAPDLNMALISVAGRYAGDVAGEAIDNGLNVMLFSDNVPLDTEVELKRKASELGLLAMGPDCGTAIINGVPLGFANVVSRGPVGVVAASGTGLQEVVCLLSREGVGISQALGTGGRDVSDDVGGTTFLAAMRALERDPETESLVLISKPPGRSVLSAIRDEVERATKPVVTVFLGMPPEGVRDARTLAEAAAKAAALANGRSVEASMPELLTGGLMERARAMASSRSEGQSRLRALMSGGTFASEAVVVLGDMGIEELSANVGGGAARPLEDPLRSEGNTVVDMGADEFTVGRPHPMIDYSLRRRRLLEESRDPATAVVLLDVVLGYGSNPDPAGELHDAVRDAASRVGVVCSVTGTERDPQVRSAVVERLTEAGAVVAPSNAQASALAGEILLLLEGR